MKLAFASVLLLLSTTSGAVDRTGKLRELMETQGLLAMFQEQMDTAREQARVQSRQMLDQVMAGLSPPMEFQTRFRAISGKFIDSLETPWTAQDIVQEWSNAYGAQFSDEELDGLVAYYKSPLGRKDVVASQAAFPKVMAHFTERAKPILERATQQYIADLNALIKECNCAKGK